MKICKEFIVRVDTNRYVVRKFTLCKNNTSIYWGLTISEHSSLLAGVKKRHSLETLREEAPHRRMVDFKSMRVFKGTYIDLVVGISVKNGDLNHTC